MALRETERVREIIERVGKAERRPATARPRSRGGREAIDAWVWNNRNQTTGMESPIHRANPHPLTP